MTPARAEALAIQALTWMAGHDEVLEAFLAQSGTAPDDLRRQAAEPEFLGFVLDHILSQDGYVVEFATHAGVEPLLVAQARTALPGGMLPNWT